MLLRRDSTPNPSLVTLYRGARDTAPFPAAVNGWDELEEGLFNGHRVVGQPGPKGKTPVDSPAFNPAEFDGAGREKKNVVRVHFGVLDIDGIDESTFISVCNRLEKLRALAYSTYNHGFKPCRWDHRVAGVSARVIFPLSRTVAAKEWPVFWLGLSSWIGLADDGKPILDPATKDESRLYFLPCVRDEQSPRFLLRSAGSEDVDERSLDVDRMITIGKTVKPGKFDPASEEDHPSKLTAVTKNNLLDLAATLNRKPSKSMKEIGKAVEAVAEGKVYAGPNERDLMLLKMTGQIARHFRACDPEKLAALFIPSFEATNHAAGYGDVQEDYFKVLEKFTRQKQKIDEQEAEIEALKSAEQRFMMREAWLAVDEDRDTPYTIEEVIEYRKDLALERPHEQGEEVLAKRWIISKGKSHYVFVGGKYMRPVTPDDLLLTLKRDLSPAESFDVRMTKTNAKGEVIDKQLGEILSDYGTVAREIVVDLNAQTSYYDAREQTMYEASCPLRAIKPQFDKRIDGWLRLLAGGQEDQYQRLCMFVAFASDLSKPCVALYLDGEGGVGKSLFANALARLWTTRSPTTMDVATSTFNDRIIRCPLVFADEALPRDFSETGTTMVRQFQQNSGRDVQRKHLAGAPMIGAIRLVMASNNKHMMDTKESLTEADVAAITERILYCKAAPGTREYLEANFADPSAIIHDDLLAAHSLALRESKKYKPVGRFMVPLDASALTRSLVTSSGIRAQICQWLVNYLQSPQKYDATGQFKVHIRDGELWANAAALADSWSTYLNDQRNPPTLTMIATAMRGLVSRDRKQARINGIKTDYRVVDMGTLIAWADETGMSNPETIEAALLVNTKIDGRRAISVVSPPLGQTTPVVEAAPVNPFAMVKNPFAPISP